jgi:hypothetical protein
MKNQIAFVSVDEQALETVSGGLLNLGNGSLNGNTINVLSGLSINVGLGDIASNILNIANAIGGCGGCGPACTHTAPTC